jgi:hypothetical protein
MVWAETATDFTGGELETPVVSQAARTSEMAARVPMEKVTAWLMP